MQEKCRTGAREMHVRMLCDAHCTLNADSLKKMIEKLRNPFILVSTSISPMKKVSPSLSLCKKKRNPTPSLGKFGFKTKKVIGGKECESVGYFFLLGIRS